MKRAHELLAFALLLGGGAACDESISKGWFVDRVRILGARVEATADTTRASISPGESLRLTWLAVGPTGSPRLSWAFAMCAPPTGNFPEPKCEGPALASGSGVSDGSERVVMDFVAPPSAAIGDVKELLVLAAFCEGGTPNLDARTFNAKCPDDRAPLLATMTVRLTADGANKNPEIAQDAIVLDGAVLPPSTLGPAGAPCAGTPEAPVILTSAGERTFAYRFRGDERESVPPDGQLENIVLSHAVSAGELDRQYSSFDREDTPPKEVTIPWTPPGAGDVPDAGRLVEIHFVLRDGRGGSAFTRRTVCARKP